MCVLSIAIPGAIHSYDDLETACWNNPDGFGYAIHTGRHILRRRSMEPYSLIERYLEDRKRYMDGPAMFHARIATSGKVDNSGCHPFFLPGNAKVVMGHNGVLPIPEETGWKSDTRYLIEDIISKDGGIDALRSPLYLAQLEKWITTRNKLAFLSADNRLPSFFILNEQEGHWANGVWWSNSSYVYSKYTYTYSGSSSSKLSTTTEIPSATGGTWIKNPDGTWSKQAENGEFVLDPEMTEQMQAEEKGKDPRDAIPTALRSYSTATVEEPTELPDCPFCETTLTQSQIDDGRCLSCWQELERHSDSEWCFCPKCVQRSDLELSAYLAESAERLEENAEELQRYDEWWSKRYVKGSGEIAL